MAFFRPAEAIHDPPSDFDDLVDWFDRISTSLVLLEEYALPEVRAAIRVFGRAVRDHVHAFDPALAPAARAPSALAGARATLRSDHARFSISLEQLDWFLGIVEHEDHGGHRQALGQYGRVVAEALRRHRAEERAYLGPATEGPDRAPA
ncbi:MAG: hypothetical protein ACREDE_02715 [Thermoplasmata archaeon]